MTSSVSCRNPPTYWRCSNSGSTRCRPSSAGAPPDDRGEQQFRRVNGHLHLPALRVAIEESIATQAVGAVRHDDNVIAA